ncbi:hypothetical protein AB1L30_15715 [Bremerella sp. JC817]|uniref:hypothetical protein n=1 Tax=Bremerella sp. JC817 TaxID=3231756 RepID=UPI00345777FC
MRYIILVEQKKKAPAMFTAPVADDDADYLRRAIDTMQPLSAEDYMQGPAAILHMLARYSYVLLDNDVYWCVEWTPGMIVIRFSPNGEMAWTAIRSPVPDFGGRTATKEEKEAYDPDAPNHQVNLVFEPWTAQFDEEDRQAKCFQPADAQTEEAFEAALASVNEIGDQIESKYGNDLEAWVYRGEEQVVKMVGEGVRLDDGE